MSTTFSLKFAEISVNDKVYTGIESISYSDSCEIGNAPSTLPVSLTSTTGNYAAEASFTMLSSDADLFLKSLTDGIYLHEWDVNIVYTAPGITDRAISLVTCRLTGINENHSNGSDALMTEFSCRVTYVERAGLQPFGSALSL
jgi:hypothetical protein